MNTTSQRSKEARAELERALSFHFQGDKARALKSLRRALELDPALSKEKLASNLAKEITGFPAEDVLKGLGDRDTSKQLIETARRSQRNPPQVRDQRMQLFVFIFLMVVLVGLFGWVISSGILNPFAGMFQFSSQKFTLNGYDYYVSVPGGDAPANGYPLVVVFHGYGGNGGQMLSLAKTFNDAGAIFVAPSLGEYQPNPGDGPLEPVSLILKEVGEQYPLQARGAILLGHSQGGSFAYRFSVHYSAQVAGVVTAGAPEFDAIFPTRNIPYIFTWGELDGLQEFVLPMVAPIQRRGYNVRTMIVPGVGHELSQYAIDQTLMLLGQP